MYSRNLLQGYKISVARLRNFEESFFGVRLFDIVYPHDEEHDINISI